MTLEIDIVRHGQTDWNITSQHTGRTDLALNDRGREESRALFVRLAGRKYDRVLVSPLSRAKETCALAGYAEHAEAWDDLMEWHYGEWEGRTKPQIAESHPGRDLWRDGAPGGESIEAMSARIDRVIARLVTLEGSVIVFAHGHVSRAIAARWAGWPLAHGRHLALDNCALSTIGSDDDGLRLNKAWNT